MRLFTIPGVFRPRSDSWLLAGLVRGRACPGDRVLDPFTGSGVLAIAAAQAGAEATAIDISRRAVACARANALLNGVRVRALRGDMLAPLNGDRFDLIAANPPYVPSAGDGTPRGAARAWAAGPDGRQLLDRLCREAPSRLRPGGSVLIVHSSVCDAGTTERMLAEGGLAVATVARQRGPLGPLMRAQMPGVDEEEVVVLLGTRAE
jgi:release factor glutamine methyltransferase